MLSRKVAQEYYLQRAQERISALESALLVANKALSETIQRCGTGYNWNSDPDKITFLAGKAFAKMKEAIEKK